MTMALRVVLPRLGQLCGSFAVVGVSDVGCATQYLSATGTVQSISLPYKRQLYHVL